VDELGLFLRRIRINLSKHRLVEIFAIAKVQEEERLLDMGVSEKNIALRGITDELNFQEFSYALEYTKVMEKDNILKTLNVDVSTLVKRFCLLVFFLILIFIFIFFGIQSFKISGTIDSIVYSALPIGASLGLGKNPKEIENEVSEEDVEQAVEDQIEAEGGD
jgi:hypothetical protein